MKMTLLINYSNINLWNQSFNQSVESIIQSILQSTCYSINHFFIHSFGQSVKHFQSFTFSIIDSFSHSISQSFNKPIVQSFGPSINQSFNRRNNHLSLTNGPVRWDDLIARDKQLVNFYLWQSLEIDSCTMEITGAWNAQGIRR